MKPPVTEVVDTEVATLLTRLEKLFSLVHQIYLSRPPHKCWHGAYCLVERDAKFDHIKIVAHGTLTAQPKELTPEEILNGVEAVQPPPLSHPEAQQLLLTAKETATWLHNNIIYVTSAEGNYRPGAIRLDRYVLSFNLGPAFDAWSGAIVVGAAKQSVNLSYANHVAAIHARRQEQPMNNVIEVAALYI